MSASDDVLYFILAYQVFAWGSGRDGQLGLGDGGKKNTPQEIPDLEDMQCIAASGNVIISV